MVLVVLGPEHPGQSITAVISAGPRDSEIDEQRDALWLGEESLGTGSPVELERAKRSQAESIQVAHGPEVSAHPTSRERMRDGAGTVATPTGDAARVA